MKKQIILLLSSTVIASMLTLPSVGFAKDYKQESDKEGNSEHRFGEQFKWNEHQSANNQNTVTKSTYGDSNQQGENQNNQKDDNQEENQKHSKDKYNEKDNEKQDQEEQSKIHKKRQEVDQKKKDLRDKMKSKLENKVDLAKIEEDLKKTTTLTPEEQALYELLTEKLQNSDVNKAIAVQKQLIEKAYQKGERDTYKKLGELYKIQNNQKVNTFVNGKTPNFDAEPVIENGTTLVPIRAIVESMDAQVKWDGEQQKVTLNKNGNEVVLYLNKNTAYVNGKEVQLEVAPTLKDGRTFLPLRFISENLNAAVTWQPEGQVIIIEDKDKTTTTPTNAQTAPMGTVIK
jgi:hypothetical protein